MSASSQQAILSKADISDIVGACLRDYPEARRVLVLTTDYSRKDFTGEVFSAVCSYLAGRPGLKIHVLNTAGTHRKMKNSEWAAKLGGDREVYPFLVGKRFQHLFDRDAHLIEIGELSGDFLAEKTAGYINTPLPVTINRRIANSYDLVLAINGTVPHEGTGFSGGTKILFPGIAGKGVIGAFHWAAVLIGIPKIIGTFDNPARDIVDKAAGMVFDYVPNTPIVSLNMVYTEGACSKVEPRGLFAGVGSSGFRRALRAAASLSEELHIVRLPKAQQTIVQQIPARYDEWWTAMKGSYKLQRAGVVEEGGEVILYAPHIHCFHSNAVMDRAIRQIGYHGREYVIRYLKKHPTFDKNVASHVINARGVGSLNGRQEQFPFRLTLASQIDERTCKAMGLGYLDPSRVKQADYQSAGALWIDHGGQDLYSR